MSNAVVFREDVQTILDGLSEKILSGIRPEGHPVDECSGTDGTFGKLSMLVNHLSSLTFSMMFNEGKTPGQRCVQIERQMNIMMSIAITSIFAMLIQNAVDREGEKQEETQP